MSNYSEIIRALQQYSGNNAFSISSLPANFDGVVLAINAMTADFQSTFDNLTITESQISDLQPYLLPGDAGSNITNAQSLDNQPASYYLNASNLNSGTIPDVRIADIGDSEARKICFDDLEKSDLSYDGDLAYDASQGLILYRSQQGVSGSPTAVTVLDGANVSAGTGISISGLGAGPTDASQIVFSVAAHSAALLTSGTVPAARINQGAGSGLDADTLDGQEGSYYTSYADTAVANLVDSSPETLNTLNELAAALGDDPDFATTVTDLIATKLPFTGGEMTGNITFSGTETVDGRDLSVDGSKLDGIETGATADQTATEILTAVKTLDGTGSGLDADLLDNNEGSYYLDYNNFVNTPPTEIVDDTTPQLGGDLDLNSNDITGTGNVNITGNITVSGTVSGTISGTVDGRDVSADGTKLDGIESGATADQTASEILTAVKTVDGTGSGLDADLLDNYEGSYYLDYNNFVNTPPAEVVDDTTPQLGGNLDLNSNDITGTGNISITGNITISGNVDGRDVSADGTKLDGIESGATADQTAAEILAAIKTVDGPGSDLNADKLDGLSSTAFYRSIDTASATVGPGWITVATNTSARRHGEVIVSDTDSGDQAFIRIDWMRSYSDSNFTVINCGGDSNRITGVRVLSETHDDAYGTKKLQVYVTVSSTYGVQINQLQNQTNWASHTAVTPVVQNSITGYALHGSQIEDLNTYSLASEEGIQAGGEIRSSSGFKVGSNTVWHAGNDGAGSGLDADSVDGVGRTGFLRSDAADEKTSGTLRFNDSVILSLGSGDDAEMFFDGAQLYLDLNAGSFYIRDNSTIRYSFEDDGNFTAAGNVTAYSDITLKKNIEVIPDSLDKVLQLRGVTFDRKDIETSRQVGVIAQEVEKVLPEAVSTGEDGIKSVAYGNMVGLLIEAMKEQQVQINKLQEKLNELEGK